MVVTPEGSVNMPVDRAVTLHVLLAL